MRKPNPKKIEKALECIREGVSLNNLKRLGFTLPQIRVVEEIVARECQKEMAEMEVSKKGRQGKRR